jgi:cytochrome d ubiquinol oxidase subunit II
MYELIIAVFVLLSLILYALLGGADFGGGMWDLLASGPRAERQRQVIAGAIGPIWEANHVWLILVIVLLFSAFPPAFAALMTALNIPVTLMLIGIVLRGSSYIFRKYDAPREGTRFRWGTVFGAASFFTPFFQGVALGALTTGRIHVVDGEVVSGFFAGWLTPFAFACGVFALVLFAFLAATYLAFYTRDEPDLQDDFRMRALWSGLALAPIALAVFLASKDGAPAMFRGLTQWWAPLLLAGTSFCAVTTFLALWRLILIGWGCAQYPHLVTPDVTLHNSAAPEATLRLLGIALAAGTMLLLPALAFLFHLFARPEIREDYDPGKP